MSFILVVEPDADSVSLIHEVLASEGLEVHSVSDPDAALQMAAARAPKLVIVNGDIQQAERLLTSFARRRGGPGAVALVSAAGTSGPSAQADEIVTKPFTDAALRQAVERCWEAARSSEASARPAAGMPLSSEEIFGEVLAELAEEDGEERDAPSPPLAGRGEELASSASPVKAQTTASPSQVNRDVEALLADTLAELGLGPAVGRKAPHKTGPEFPPAISGDRRRKASREVGKAPTVPGEQSEGVVVAPGPTPEEESSPTRSAEVTVEESTEEALEPLVEVEREIKDRRDRAVLIGAIIVTALIGVLLVVLLNFLENGEPEIPPVSVVSTGESAPTLKSFCAPNYPEMARRLHMEGTVVAGMLATRPGRSLIPIS